MTFLEAALEILRHEGKPLHYKELTERALGKKLLTFVGRTPEVTMQTQLTAAVKKAPGNPFVRVKPGIFGLLRYPEVTAEERAAYAKADAPRGGRAGKAPDGERGGRGRDGGRRPRAGPATAATAGGRDRATRAAAARARRRGGEDDAAARRGAPAAAAGAAAGRSGARRTKTTDIDAEEPQLARAVARGARRRTG